MKIFIIGLFLMFSFNTFCQNSIFVEYIDTGIEFKTFHQDTSIGCTSELCGVFNKKGEIIVPIQYEIITYSNQFIKVFKNGKYGYFDYDGREIIPAKYTELSTLSNGLIKAQSPYHVDYYDKNGKVNLSLITDFATDFSQEFAFYTKDNQLVCINKQGESLYVKDYQQAAPFSEGLALVYKNGAFGYINTKGEEVIPLIYRSGTNFLNGASMVSTKENYLIINKQGKQLLSINRDFFREENSWGLSFKNDKQENALFNKNGEILSSFKESNISFLNDGWVKVISENKTELFYNGKKIISSNFENVRPVSDTIFKTEKEGKFGLISIDGDEIIAPKYDRIGYFKDGISKVSLNGKKGYINTNGAEITPIIYDDANDFYGGVGKIWTENGEIKFINQEGKILENYSDYTTIEKLSEGYIAVKKNGKFGYVDSKNHIKIDFQYDEAGEFHNGIAAVRKGDKFGLINKKGEYVMPLKYTKAASEKSKFPYVQIIEREEKNENSKKIYSYKLYLNHDGKCFYDCNRSSQKVKQRTDKIATN